VPQVFVEICGLGQIVDRRVRLAPIQHAHTKAVVRQSEKGDKPALSFRTDDRPVSHPAPCIKIIRDGQADALRIVRGHPGVKHPMAFTVGDHVRSEDMTVVPSSEIDEKTGLVCLPTDKITGGRMTEEKFVSRQAKAHLRRTGDLIEMPFAAGLVQAEVLQKRGGLYGPPAFLKRSVSRIFRHDG